MAKGGGLLFVTNRVGISLAASATFLVMGFAPFERGRKGLAITLLLMTIIIGPLCAAFVDQEKIVQQIPTGKIELAGRRVGVRIVDIRTGTPPLVRVIPSSSRRLDESHIDALKQLISERIGMVVLVQAQLNLRR